MKCLDKDRARRYETTDGVAADLQRHLSDEPVVARPPSLDRLPVPKGLAAEQSDGRRGYGNIPRAGHRPGSFHLDVFSGTQGLRANSPGGTRTGASPLCRGGFASTRWYFRVMARAWRRQGIMGGMVFDLASRKSIFRFQDGRVMSLAFSHDGRFLAAGTGSDLIHLWDVISGQTLGTLRGHVAGVASLAFSPDGKTLASCGDSRVKLWNIETLQEILTLFRSRSGTGAALFSSNGSCLATSSQDDRVQLWRAPSF